MMIGLKYMILEVLSIKGSVNRINLIQNLTKIKKQKFKTLYSIIIKIKKLKYDYIVLK